jgi:hypothetical protein
MTGAATARLEASVKPVADGGPSEPGSDRSHDRNGVCFYSTNEPVMELAMTDAVHRDRWPDVYGRGANNRSAQNRSASNRSDAAASR